MADSGSASARLRSEMDQEAGGSPATENPIPVTVTTQQPSKVITLLWIIFNVASVVSIVIINKHIYMALGFRFGNMLCTLHLFTTTLLAWGMASAGFFDKKLVPLPTALALAFSNFCSVMFVNLSLLYNSVGMYQVLKLANIPVLCIVEWLVLGKTYSLPIMASLGVLLLGVGITSVTDVSLNFWGLMHGVLATLGTAAYQILVGTEQKRFGVHGLQVLLWMGGPTSLLFATTIPLTDEVAALTEFHMTWTTLGYILTSCAIAAAVNVSVFFIIGRASALTFQVVGHLKTMLVFLFAFVVLHEPVVFKNLLGIFVACLGMIWYSRLKMM
eukprot:TRINITY_DN5609_c0_g1_i2.p1 TRINITY_DN5609_c0_g1~~TRINITY_DN5609_c0_g1_i2.p1  ORF type:complete len:329 (-),score=72.20 TRINITY_DN5609_c0_g1_i2:752-1738(-)